MFAKSTVQPKYNATSKKLGHGSYGLVDEYVDVTTGKKVAVKTMSHFDTDSTDAKWLLREITILRTVRGHPNIISLEDLFITPKKTNEIKLVFERCDTDLGKVIRSKQSLSNNHFQFFLYQILYGIYFIHSAKLVHRDLKPANILINSNCDIKICDFGLARAIQQINETNSSNAELPSPPPVLFRQLTGYVVTRWYRSPELILNYSRGGEAPADMWSIGCILAELLLGIPIFAEGDPRAVLSSIFDLIGTPAPEDGAWLDDVGARHYLRRLPSKPRQNFALKFPHVHPDALDLLQKLLEFNPSKRISAEQAMRHPFVNSYFNHQHLLTTYSLESKSAEDKSSLADYMQFETELDSPSTRRSSTEITQWACDLIQKEAARYNAELPSSADITQEDTAAKSSAIASTSNTTSSFFYNADVPSGVSAAGDLSDADHPIEAGGARVSNDESHLQPKPNA